MYIPIATAQDMLGAQNKASIFFIKCTDAAFTQQTADAIRTLLPNYSVTPIKQYMALMTSNNLPRPELLHYGHDQPGGRNWIPRHLPFHVHHHY